MRREKKKVEKNIYDNYLAILREEMVPAMDARSRLLWLTVQQGQEKFLEKNRSTLWQNAPEIL